MALVLTKTKVSKTPDDQVQVDISNLDESIFVSLLLSEAQAWEFVRSIAYILTPPKPTFTYAGFDISLELRDEVRALYGMKINAIKRVREVMSIGLKESKDVVEAIFAEKESLAKLVEESDYEKRVSYY